jgi:hypothetical protein
MREGFSRKIGPKPLNLLLLFFVFSKGNRLAHKYSTDLNYEDFVVEMQHLSLVHKTKFGKAELKLLKLLNILTDYKLCEIFLNVCVSFRILLTIPATVASAVKSFSKLKLIKNSLSTMSTTGMSETRLVDLAAEKHFRIFP